jgi:hypothetical protein
MKSRMCIQVVMIFLAVAIVCFDRHLAYYCPDDMAQLISAENIPVHSDLPVKACDYHEDITVKTLFYSVPARVVVSVREYRVFQLSIPHMSPHTVWQPPEHNS